MFGEDYKVIIGCIEIVDGGLECEPAAQIKISGWLVWRSAGGFQYQQVAVPFLHFFFHAMDQGPADPAVLELRVNRNPVDIIRPSRERMGAITGESSYNVVFMRNQEEIPAGWPLGEVFLPQFAYGFNFNFAEYLRFFGYFFDRRSVFFLGYADGKHLTASRRFLGSE